MNQLLYEFKQQARAEGRAEGFAEGRAEGLAEVMAEFHALDAQRIRKLIQHGNDESFVAELFGITIDELRQIVDQVN